MIVKLLLTATTLALMFLAGKRYFPPEAHVPWFSFTIALLISTWSVLSIGFVIASIVPTARFAQPIGAIVLYPMIAFSGLFVHISDSAAGAARCGTSTSADLRCAPARGDLEWRRVVGPPE